MAFKTEEIAALLRRLEADFPDVDPPENQTEKPDYDLAICRRLFGGRVWRSIEPETVSQGYNCLLYFEDDLVAYYVPSYVRSLLIEGLEEQHRVPYWGLMRLLRDHGERLARSWSEAQRWVVADFLELCAQQIEDSLRAQGAPPDQILEHGLTIERREASEQWRLGRFVAPPE